MRSRAPAPPRTAQWARHTWSRGRPRSAPGGETWARNLTPLPSLRNASLSVALPTRRPQIARSMRLRLTLLVATWLPALTGGANLAAQEASPHVPLGPWVMPYVEPLIAAGVIRDPTPLTRPFHQGDLVRALEAVDTQPLSRATRATLHQLEAALGNGQRVPHVRVEGGVGAAAANYARREPLAAIDSIGPRQSGPGHGTANADLNLALVTSHVVAVTHLQVDTRLKYDPDWFGKKDPVIAGRTAEAYVDAWWKFGGVFFGRLDRNWGPPGIQGLLLSANPYGLDHFAVTVGSAKLQLQALATQLDDRDSNGVVVHRFMVQHRLRLVRGRWGVALWEGTVLAGRDRAFEAWYLNALNAGILEQWNGGGKGKSFLGVDR